MALRRWFACAGHVGEGGLERDLRSVAALSELSLVQRTATVVVVTVEVAVTTLNDVT